MKFYLAHPFDARKWVRKWELEIEAAGNVELLNPFYDQPNRTDVERIDAGRAQRYEELIASDLVRKDLAYMLLADGLVGLVTGDLSYGTIMEIVYANIFDLPVYLAVTNGEEKHPWLRQHSDVIFTSSDAMKHFLTHYKAEEYE